MKGLLALLLSLVYVVYVVGQTCPASSDFIIFNGPTAELTISASTGDVTLCGGQNLCTYLQNANTWSAVTNTPTAVYKTEAGSFFAEGTGPTAPIYDGLPENNVTREGNKFFFYGKKGAIRAGTTDSSASGTAAFSDAGIGDASAAFGTNSLAEGTSSTAFGYQNRATGVESTAFGYQTQAMEAESTSFGFNTTAMQIASTAFGRSTIASGIGSTAFGVETTASERESTAFGKLTSAEAAESTAFGIDGDTANTTASALYTPLQANYPGAPATTNIPNYVGPATSGEASTAFGASTRATAQFATAWGFGTYAEGVGSTAFGTQGQAEGYNSVTWGLRSYAEGAYSTAFGVLTSAIATRSTAFGYETAAQFADSTAFGFGSVAQGLESTAMGVNSYAKVYAELVVGTCNVEAPNATNVQSDFNAELSAFTVGNGVPSGFNCTSYSDAFTVLRNGDVMINRDIYFRYGDDPFAETPSGCYCLSNNGQCLHGCTGYDPSLFAGKKRSAEVASLREEVDELKREIGELRKLIVKA